MFIKHESAQYIVEQLKDIIDQDINFTSENGKIIASTDASRIGEYLEVASISVNKNETVITEFDGEYKGSKKGIDMPINYKNQVVGAIGITGPVEEVRKYGEIIQKMAEILVLENLTQSIEFSNRERDRLIIEQILNFSGDYAALEQLHLTDFNFSKSFRTLVLKVNSQKEYAHYYLENLLDDKFNPENEIDSYYYLNNDDYYYILTKDTSKKTLTAEINQLVSDLKYTDVEIEGLGIGKICDDIESAQQSFAESEKSLEWNLQFNEQIYTFYDELDLGIIGTSIPHNIRQEFIEKILVEIPTEEFDKLKGILYAYGENNCSVNKSSAQLFMHKNTFQYQLNKIEKYTGYDPKNIEDYVILKMAFLINDLTQ